MANYQINRPKFNLDAKEKLIELESLKTEATILFDDPYHKMENNEKMSIVLNWLGRQAIQIIKSQGITPRIPEKIYDALENNFRPESHYTVAKFRFCSMKQKRSDCRCIFN